MRYQEDISRQGGAVLQDDKAHDVLDSMGTETTLHLEIRLWSEVTRAIRVALGGGSTLVSTQGRQEGLPVTSVS